VYLLDGSNDVYVRCKVCALDNAETYLFLQGGQTSNGTRRFETTVKGKGSAARRGDHLLAALYLAKNFKGGPRTRLTAADGAITQVMRPADRREHHVQFVLMQIMTSFSHAFGASANVCSFLADLRINYAPPALARSRCISRRWRPSSPQSSSTSSRPLPTTTWVYPGAMSSSSCGRRLCPELATAR